MKTESEIVMIKTKNLHHHPDNPRKDLGDVTELADSIKKNGIMQNLTVIPIGSGNEEAGEQTDANKIDPCSDFLVLIGNRRMEACLQAGVEEAPCKIVSNISKKEQVAIMLEENMQRSDLTVYEQAQGFQMMLDLGETVDSISEKTGFSKATVYHRVNLAKLDGNLLKGKTDEDGDFQLTLKDLYVLEKIKDPEERNEILGKAQNSLNLQYLVNDAVKRRNQQEREDRIVEKCKALGLSKAPSGAECMWSSSWDKVIQADLDEEKQVEEFLSQLDQSALDPKTQFYVRYQYSSRIAIVQEHEETKEEISPEEQRERKEKWDRLGTIKAKARQIQENLRDFAEECAKGKIGGKLKNSEETAKSVWKCLLYLNEGEINIGSLREWVNPYDDDYEELTDEQREEIDKIIEGYDLVQQLMLMLATAIDNSWELRRLTDYSEPQYQKEHGDIWKMLMEVFQPLGFSVTKEEQAIIDGTSELYDKAEEKDKEE